MKDNKEPDTRFIEIIIDCDAEAVDVDDVDDVEIKDFGLSPDEYEAEIAYQRRRKLPVLEGDATLITKNIDLERRNDD